jgi:hypothetical protein
MPNTQQDKFEDASETTHNTTLHKTQDYMQRQSKKDRYEPYSKAKNSIGNSNNHGHDNGHGGHFQGCRGRGRNNGCGGPGNNNNGNNNFTCPLPGHGGHTVAQCYCTNHQQQQQAPQGCENAAGGNNQQNNNNTPPDANVAEQVPTTASSLMSSNSTTQPISTLTKTVIFLTPFPQSNHWSMIWTLFSTKILKAFSLLLTKDSTGLIMSPKMTFKSPSLYLLCSNKTWFLKPSPLLARSTANRAAFYSKHFSTLAQLLKQC